MPNRSLKSYIQELSKERLKLNRYANKIEKTHEQSKLYSDRLNKAITQEEKCIALVDKINKRLPETKKLSSIVYNISSKDLEELLYN